MGETLIIPIIDIQKDMKLAVVEGIGTALWTKRKEKMLEQYRKELEAELSAVNELLKEKI